MADVHDFGDDGILDPDEEEQNEDHDPISEALHVYLGFWHYWYNIIVHRGANVAPLQMPPYTVDFVSDDIRPAPFLLDISETWYCSALIALILAVHHGVNKGWLFETGYPSPQWAGRVLGRVLLTVGAAILSTISFEIIGSLSTATFRTTITRIEDWISTFLIKRLRWGQVGENGEPLRDGANNFMWVVDPANRREAVRETLQGLAVFVFDYLATFLLEVGNQLTQLSVERILAPVLYFFFAIPVNFVPKLLSWLFLPTPGLDTIQDPRTLWFEYGVPIVIQFWLLVLLWLLKILFMAKAERLAMQGWPVIDPPMTIIWHLIRATAMHLLAYTSYQLVCGIIVAMKWALPEESWYITVIDGPVVPFLGRIMPNGRIFAAVLLFFFHWLLRAASVLGVRLAENFWMPYILWQTRYSVGGAGRYWPLFVDSLAADLSLLDPTKRVTSRVAMTALFGLRSSWPARFHLSNVVDDD
ncbi:hypothetical protein E0Z10_g9000 [Xylaria hypoxylon]|uniref:Uncharacterized protein n=1 Tax=Xylaria hypoxylon TaxID=37992 RepID=A0A4Z0Y6T4_9PEZI|nr:hypothetical protein E0Z10_g9000 [Xylaria hypoxylon]